VRLASVLGLVLFLGGCPIEVDLPDASLPSELRHDGGVLNEDADEQARDAGARPPAPMGYDGGFADLPGMTGERRAPGRIDLYLTDAPAEFDSVWVTIGRIEAAAFVDGQERWVPLGGMPQRFDLLTLRNDESAALGSAWVPAVAYRRLRLHVIEAAVVVQGQEQPLPLPDGLQHGIEIDFGLKVDSNITYAVLLDFDAAASIHFDGDHFVMHPVIHVKHVTRMTPDGWSDQPLPGDAGAPNTSEGDDHEGDDDDHEDVDAGASN
jgi:hypothetical protein